MRHSRFSALIASAVTVLVGAAAFPQGSGTRVREIFVPQISEFTQDHSGVVNSFDLSPDGETLAVEFGTHVPAPSRKYGKFEVWVALWSVEAQHLVAVRRLEDDLPTYKEGQYRKDTAFAWYARKLRFSPDGRTLLVLTGPHLIALSFPKLQPMWSLEDPVEPDSHEAWMVFTDFSFSALAGRVAVLRQYPKGVPNIVGPHLFEVLSVNLEDGKVLSRWSKEGHSEGIGLSPDGSLLTLALTVDELQLTESGFVPMGRDNVLVFKAASGEEVRALNTGPVAGDAQFLDGARTLVTVTYDHGSSDPKWYLRCAVKFWNLETGKLDRELEYPKYGVRSSAELAISGDGEWLAVADPWHNPADIKADRDVTRSWVRLLVWHVPTGNLVYDSGDLGQDYRLHGEDSHNLFGGPVLVRVSESGSRLAVGGDLISVYSIEKEHREIAAERVSVK